MPKPTKREAYQRLTKSLAKSIAYWRHSVMDSAEWETINVLIGDDLDHEMAEEAICVLKLQEN